MKKKNVRFLTKTTVTTFDTGSGEVKLVEETKTYPVNTQDEYYQSYSDYEKFIYSMTSIVDMKMIKKMCEFAEYNTNKVHLHTNRRNEIIMDLKIASSQISTSIKNLVNLGVLKGKRGGYILNPLIYWKGETSKRQDVLKEISEELLTDVISKGQ